MTVPKRSKQILLVVSVLLTLAAVADQLRQPRGERTWQGKIIGVTCVRQALGESRPIGGSQRTIDYLSRVRSVLAGTSTCISFMCC